MQDRHHSGGGISDHKMTSPGGKLTALKVKQVEALTYLTTNIGLRYGTFTLKSAPLCLNIHEE
jgi:hypothetical protein